MLGWEAVENVHWEWLFHAYGVAEETPEKLRGLTSEDAALREAGIDHLEGVVLHQGTIYAATAPAVRVVAGILNEPILREPLDDEAPTLRAGVAESFSGLEALLGFLAEAGESLAWADEVEEVEEPTEKQMKKLAKHLRKDEDGEDDKGWLSPMVEVMMKRAVLDLRAMAPEVLEAIVPFVLDENPEIAQAAMNAVGKWSAVQVGSPQAEAAAQVLRTRLEAATHRNEKANLVLALGEMGQDVSAWLDDEDEAVRACAALFVRTSQANEILIGALTHPEQVNSWFASAKPAYFPLHVRFRLLGEVIERGVTIEQVLPAAVALISQSSAMAADAEWGPILRVTFPDAQYVSGSGVRPPLPEHLTAAQRAVLEALVANENLWDPTNGNARFARMEVGLPNTREEVTAYIRDTPVEM